MQERKEFYYIYVGEQQVKQSVPTTLDLGRALLRKLLEPGTCFYKRHTNSFPSTSSDQVLSFSDTLDGENSMVVQQVPRKHPDSDDPVNFYAVKA